MDKLVKVAKRMFDTRRRLSDKLRRRRHDEENSRELVRGDSIVEASQSCSFNDCSCPVSCACDSELLGLLQTFEWMSENMAISLASWIPPRMTLLRPRILFDTHEHGVSFSQLWRRTQDAHTSIIIVRTSQGDIFGAYCSRAWAERNAKERLMSKFFGTGETFVFRLKGSDGNNEEKPRRWQWVAQHLCATAPLRHSRELFMAAESTWLQIGGGSGEALLFEGTLERGRSAHCDTFDNEPLHTGDPNRPFDVAQFLLSFTSILIDYRRLRKTVQVIGFVDEEDPMTSLPYTLRDNKYA